MALNIETYNKLTAETSAVSEFISKEESDNLFDKRYVSAFNDEQKKFEKAFKDAQEEGRKLRIGVIGSVKAGKSSFLNALFFDGEDRLPKAATPMTAALTVISYSEEPKALIHFYSQEDWTEIEQKAKEYDSELNKRYAEYEKEYNKNLEESEKTKSIFSGAKFGFEESEKKKNPYFKRKVPKLYSKAEYEAHEFRNNVDEALSSSKELVEMASKSEMASASAIYEKIGKEPEEVNPENLNQYIGAGGKYTAIVNYVELFTNDKALDGFQIVDTPGLNDPIVSRGRKTMEYLATCDVAVLLSSTTQFMDASTMGLMLNTLPSSGVREIILVGSKLDSGMLDYKESGIDIKKVYNESIKNYRLHIANNINEVQLSEPEGAEKLKKSPVAFVSALLYSMYIKRKKGMPFNEEEQHIYNLIKKRFTNFEDKLLLSLSGIGNIRKELNAVFERKEEIINEKNNNLCNVYSDKFQKILCDIRSDATQSKIRLETMNVEGLRKRQSGISNSLERSRMKLNSVCHNEAVEVKGRVEILKAQLKMETGNVENPTIKSKTLPGHYTYKSGLFNLKTNYVSYDETINYVEVSDAVQKIKLFTGRLQISVLDDFKTIIDKEKLKKKVKDILQSFVDKHDDSYTEEDILIPLESTIMELSVPKLSISENKYIDDIRAGYKEGKAEGNDVHKFQSSFTSALCKIADDISKDMDKHTERITRELEKKAEDFITQLNTKMSSEIERLESQIAEKEKNIQRYKNFLDELNKKIADFDI